jgi:hypothetical protein
MGKKNLIFPMNDIKVQESEFTTISDLNHKTVEEVIKDFPKGVKFATNGPCKNLTGLPKGWKKTKDIGEADILILTQGQQCVYKYTGGFPITMYTIEFKKEMPELYKHSILKDSRVADFKYEYVLDSDIQSALDSLGTLTTIPVVLECDVNFYKTKGLLDMDIQTYKDMYEAASTATGDSKKVIAITLAQYNPRTSAPYMIPLINLFDNESEDFSCLEKLRAHLCEGRVMPDFNMAAYLKGRLSDLYEGKFKDFDISEIVAEIKVEQ